MSFKQISIWFVGLLVLGLASCNNNFDDPSAGQLDINTQQIRDYLIKSGLASRVTTASSGLYYVITDTTRSSATAKVPALGDEVEFIYTLSYINGGTAVFVDSIRSSKPMYYPFGIGAIIPGLEQGVSLLREGQKATLVMPYTLGFGGDARTINGVTIPAYSPVIFTVQLIRARTQSEQIADYTRNNGLLPLTTYSDSVKVFWRKSTQTGDVIASGDSVQISYRGTLLRGAQAFDSSAAYKFRFFSSNFIAGFASGLTKLRQGDSAVIIFPSTQGYGTQGLVSGISYVVPPYAPLAFEITVTSVKKNK